MNDLNHDDQTLYFPSAADFRHWLEAHYADTTELWVGFYKKQSGKTGMTYKEAVDLALCFGWIDGIRKTVDTERYKNRFTPRKPGSNWSAVNLKRVEELTEAGLMHENGLRVHRARDLSKAQLYSYEAEERRLTPEQEAQFQQHPAAWAWFTAQSPYYQKTAGWWVISAKRPETRQKRLETLIEDSASGRRIASLRPSDRIKHGNSEGNNQKEES